MSAVDLYLIRHGETDWNVERRAQGYTDIALNAVGLQQAQCIAEALSNTAIEQVWSSDLQRALQTAQPIADIHGLSVQQATGLRERCFGGFEGLIDSQMAVQFPEQYALHRQSDPDVVLPTSISGREAETFRAFFDRTVMATEEICRIAQTQGIKRLAMVAHGGVLDVIRRRAIGLAIEAPRDVEIANASIHRLRWENQRLHLVSWGNVAHLLSNVTNLTNVTHVTSFADE